MRRLVCALALVPIVGSARAEDPIPLWKNGQAPFSTKSCGSGQIPRGGPDGQDWQWKEYLRNYLKTITVADVDLGSPAPVPISFDDGIWMSPLYNTDLACMQDPAWGPLLPAVATQIEDIILHAASEEWGGDALVRMSLAPQHFILAALEDTTTCRVNTPSYAQDPELTSWAHMSYDGNPYYTDAAIHEATLTRGAVWLAWNMLVWDYLSWTVGNAQGRFPCSTTACAQPAAVISPATGLVIPVPGQPYLDYTHTWRTLGNPVTPVSYHEESGGLLAVMAGTYLHVRDALPAPLRQAMETALYRFADRVAHQGMWVNMANLNHRVLVALRLVAETQSDPGRRAVVMSLYAQEAADFYDPSYGFGGIYQPQGTFRDVGGFDIGYNNYNLLHVARLAWLDGPSAPPALLAAAHTAFDLWGHQIFPDPLPVGPIYVSPSAFNTRTGKGAATGTFFEGSVLQRLLLGGAAGLPYAWAALAHSSWSLDAGAPWSAGLALFTMCNRYILHFHALLAGMITNLVPWPDISFAAPTAYPGIEPPFERHGTLSRAYATPNFAFLFGRGSGLLAQWEASQGTSVEELPYEHPIDAYYRNFADAFFYAMPERADTNPAALVALVHAGPVSPVVGTLPFGYGGGQLATLWNQDGGVFWLARRRGNNGGGGDDPAEWRSIPLHAVTLGRDPAGQQWTSSARVVQPIVSSQQIVDAPAPGDALAALSDAPGTCPPASLNPFTPTPGTTAQHVRVCGDIPTGVLGAPLLSAPIGYRRDFLVGHGYVAVQTLLAPQAADPLVETYETLPLYFGVDHPQHHLPGDWTVEAYAGNTLVASWDIQTVAPPFVWADRVVVHRYGGTLTITFDQLEHLGLSDRWAGVAGYESRNLLVDVYPTGATFTPRAVRYVMRTY